MCLVVGVYFRADPSLHLLYPSSAFMILPVVEQDFLEFRCNGTLLSAQQLSFTSSCKNIDYCRTLWSIIWSCLATLVACTWVSVHPNIPAPYNCLLPLHRVRLMLLAIIAPEIIVLWALRQRMVARDLSKSTYISGYHMNMAAQHTTCRTCHNTGPRIFH